MFSMSNVPMQMHSTNTNIANLSSSIITNKNSNFDLIRSATNYENKHIYSDINLSENKIQAKITNSNSKQTKNLSCLKRQLTYLDLRKKGFHIMHFNVQHLIPKYNEIEYILTSSNNNKRDVLRLCETYLSESIVDFNLDIPGYSYLRKDRRHKEGGGVISIFCKSLQKQTGI